MFHLLMNTGADVGEVLSRRVRDVSFGESSQVSTTAARRLIPICGKCRYTPIMHMFFRPILPSISSS